MSISGYLAGAEPEHIIDRPVLVPANFLMIHTNAKGPPVLPFKIPLGRSHDSDVGGWAGCELKKGQYDFTKLDAFVSAFPAGVCFTSYSTPSFYASRTDKDHYGNAGANSPPTDLAAYARFLLTMTSRYKGMVPLVEGWNEADDMGFYNGTMAELADMCAVGKVAVKSGNGARMLSPSFVHPQDTLAAFLCAKGPTTGQFGRDTFDDLSIHNYGSLPFPVVGGDDLAWSGMGGVMRARRVLSSAGISRRIHMTEFGFGVQGSAQLQNYLALPANLRRQRMAGSLILLAALEVQTVGLYSLNSLLCGNLQTDTTGAMAGVQDALDFLAAPVFIMSLPSWHDGSAIATNSRGQTYSWRQS